MEKIRMSDASRDTDYDTHVQLALSSHVTQGLRVIWGHREAMWLFHPCYSDLK